MEEKNSPAIEGLPRIPINWKSKKIIIPAAMVVCGLLMWIISVAISDSHKVPAKPEPKEATVSETVN